MYNRLIATGGAPTAQTAWCGLGLRRLMRDPALQLRQPIGLRAVDAADMQQDAPGDQGVDIVGAVIVGDDIQQAGRIVAPAGRGQQGRAQGNARLGLGFGVGQGQVIRCGAPGPMSAMVARREPAKSTCQRACSADKRSSTRPAICCATACVVAFVRPTASAAASSRASSAPSVKPASARDARKCCSSNKKISQRGARLNPSAGLSGTAVNSHRRANWLGVL